MPAFPMSASAALAPTSAHDEIAVPLVRWPDEADLRDQLAHKGLPRLLVVGSEAQAPEIRDELEDWLRDPPDPADLVARIASLSHRARQRRRQPRLDEDGLLWCDRRWVVIPDGQVGVVEVLLANPRQLVRTELITSTYTAGGGSGHRATIKTMLNRLQRRFAEVGLTLHFVRGKGVILEAPTVG